MQVIIGLLFHYVLIAIVAHAQNYSSCEPLEQYEDEHPDCYIYHTYGDHEICFRSGNSVAMSRTSSEEELKMILDTEDEDKDHKKIVFSELQNTVPGMPAFIPPQVPVHSCSTAFQPTETNFVRCTKPAPLTLSLSGDDSDIPTTPPPGPSTAEAEEMWKEYTKNRSTAPEYFLFPPFTPEQEEWIVTTNHPFKEYVLQTWQSSIHSSVQGWLEDLVN